MTTKESIEQAIARLKREMASYKPYGGMWYRRLESIRELERLLKKESLTNK